MADVDVIGWVVIAAGWIAATAFLIAVAKTERRLRKNREYIDQHVGGSISWVEAYLKEAHRLEEEAVERAREETRARIRRARRRGSVRLAGRALDGRRPRVRGRG